MQDETYRQILFHDKFSFKQKTDFSIPIQFRNQFFLIVFICLILIPYTTALPITSSKSEIWFRNEQVFFFVCILDAPLRFDVLRPTYKIYRHSTPSPIEFLKRERYRRKMIEKLVSLFDDDRSFVFLFDYSLNSSF